MAITAKATCVCCAFILLWCPVQLDFIVQDRSLREKVVETFKDEVGVSEVGGDNQGERVTQYLNATGLDAGYAWCAAFAAWGFNQHDIDNPESAWSPDWFPDSNNIFKRGHYDKKEWKPGDVEAIYFQSKGRIAHMGVIEKVKDDVIISIEGNTNDHDSREGDEVMRKRRYKRQVYAVARYIF